MNKKKISLEIPEEYYWKAKEYGSKNKIDKGLTGVILEALKELIPNIQGDD